MFRQSRLNVILCIVLCLLQTYPCAPADKYTDENRPYEFGFNIDGEQHRHEKKDENGLIMGEFGFITADGVYHVTVYATDENGNFKILSMKNIRVKPYPTAPSRKGNSLPFPPSGQSPVAQAPASQPQEPVSIEPPARSCSHCSIPTTKAPLPASVLSGVAVVSRDGVPENALYPQNPQYPENAQYPQNPQYPENSQYPENPQYPQNPNYPPGAQDYPQQSGQGQPGSPQQGLQPGERNPKQFDLQAPVKPQLISAQMQLVDKNTDVNQRGPGEKEGLPDGLTKKDMKFLLYTFNYTVGFHGHHEEGYSDGSKIGYYYVTNRNGVRTRVDYVADEKGFRPKITQEVLDLLSEDVPKPETEKDEKYGLKGYEFKWIYYPAESRR